MMIKVVWMSYPKDTKYLANKIWSNYDMCSSKYCSKLRNRGINNMYVGVELLYKHTGTPQRFLA